jgi:polyhydroxybutyrate depolymerase
VDDVQFIRDLLDQLPGMAAVDPERVYATGMSAGGAMSHRLACELADRIAAAGVVAGPMVDAPCAPSRPVPMIAFYGTADPLVNYEGGRVVHGPESEPLRSLMGDSTPNAVLMPAETWAAGWVGRNGCSPVPEPIPAQGDVSGQRYTGCEDGADVVFYRIEGGGHTWPGGTPLSIVGKTSKDIDASETMWEFFKEHTP